MNKTVKNIITALFIIAAVGVISYCGYQIITTLQERALAKKEYVNVKDSYVSAIDGNGDAKEESSGERRSSSDPHLKVDHEGLLKINSDYIGWIYYADGGMSYPVTKAAESNPDYYLDHSFEGQNLSSGCIFIDTNAEEDFSDRNTFLYGHNMANGTMMGSLKNVYDDPSLYSDPYIYLYLKDGSEKVYRVFSLYVTTENDKKTYMIPNTDSLMQSYIGRGLRLGTAYVGVDKTEEESQLLSDGSSNLITLSTCFGRAGTTKRLVCHAVLVEER